MIDNQEFKTKMGIDYQYTIVSGLPSKNRSYPNISNIYVRDLMFDEIRAVSTTLDEFDINQLSIIYNDAIKITTTDGNMFDNKELELADFHYLIIIISILTSDSASWSISRPCVECSEMIEKSFHYSTITYSNNSILSVPTAIANTDKFVLPLKVKDYHIVSDSDSLFDSLDFVLDRDTFNYMLSHAISLKYNTEQDIIDNIKYLNSKPKLLSLIKEINKENKIIINPFVCNCNSCGTENNFQYNFSNLWGYL